MKHEAGEAGEAPNDRKSVEFLSESIYSLVALSVYSWFSVSEANAQIAQCDSRSNIESEGTTKSGSSTSA